MEKYDLLIEAYLDYNPEEDPNGSIGMKIAEAIFRRCDYNLKKLNLEIKIQRLKRIIR